MTNNEINELISLSKSNQCKIYYSHLKKDNLKYFWQIQSEIEKAMESEDNNLIDILGDEQVDIVKQMNNDEFNELIKGDLPREYIDYIKKLRIKK